jgi:hypothetical protein
MITTTHSHKPGPIKGVTSPALPPQQAVSHAPAPADVLSGDFPEALAQLGLFDIDDLSPMALGAAVLPSHPPQGSGVARS